MGVDKGKEKSDDSCNASNENDRTIVQSRHRSNKLVGTSRRKYLAYPTLYVKGYPFGWFPLNLERIFGRAGAVMDVIMPRDKETGAYRGFALIRMGSEVELARAVHMLHGVSYDGKKLLVQRAQFGLDTLSTNTF